MAARPPQFFTQLRLAGLICRPRLEPLHQQSLAETTDQQLRRLLAATGPLQRIAPLVAHHLMLLRPALSRDCAPVLRQAVRDDFRRRQALRELLDALADSRLPPPVLVQGTALAPRYPASALRPSVDLDLLLDPTRMAPTAALLGRLGWRATGGIWVHPNGTLLDLHQPASALARQLLREAQPHPQVPGALQPPDGLQLVLLARHCGRHQGDRLWRDVADLQLLTDNGRLGAVVETAIARAPGDTRAPLAALLAFANRHTEPAERLPESAVSPGDYLPLLEHQARWRRPAAELDLLQSLVTWPRRRLLGERGAAPEARRTDPVLGRLPAPGLGLQLYKLRVAVGLLTSAHGWRGLRLVRLRHRCAIKEADFGTG